MRCAVCCRRLKRAWATMARYSSDGSFLVPVGPVGPVCGRGVLVMPAPQAQKAPSQPRVRLAATPARKRRVTQQVDWIEQLAMEAA